MKSTLRGFKTTVNNIDHGLITYNEAVSLMAKAEWETDIHFTPTKMRNPTLNPKP